MSNINAFALERAAGAAARLWALASAPFPLINGAPMQEHIERDVTDTAIDFAIHTRRILDNKGITTKLALDAPFRIWSPRPGLQKVDNLRDALNRIVHATHFEVGFEQLQPGAAQIDGGAIGVLYLRTTTDKRSEALIDVFALASCFFQKLLPMIQPDSQPAGPRLVN